MIGEIDVAGVFIPAILIWALASMTVEIVVRQILAATGFYRLVWHRGLFDLALFFILWGIVAFMVNRFGVPTWAEP